MHRLSNLRREKIFGDAPRSTIDGNGKARIMAFLRAYNARLKQPREHWGPVTRAAFELARVLLYGFHHADDGRVFPSYEALAKAARCHRDTVAKALRVLERAGVLTWVHRLMRVRHRERDLFGKWTWITKVERTSNGYTLIDPSPPGRAVCKSENPPGPAKQDSNNNQLPLPALDPADPLALALASYGRAAGLAV